MTKRIAPALMPLSDDPTQSSLMRELLHAGRDVNASDYNFEQGLQKHLALIEAGAPMPKWAEGLRHAAPGGAAQAAAGSSLVPWLVVPIVAAVAVTAAVFVTRQVPSEPAIAAQNRGAVTEPSAAAVPAATAQQDVPAPSAAPRSPAGVAPAGAAISVREAPGPRSAQAGTRAAHGEKRPAAVASPSRATNAGSGTAPALRGGVGSTSAPAAVNAAPAPATAPVSTELFAQAQPAHPSVEPRPEAANPTKPERAQAQVARNTPPQPAPEDESKLEREMAMLAMAQRVLLTDPARALGLTRQGEAEFAGSMFTQERQQLLLLSLVRLGRIDEAKRLAKPYLTRYPAGPFSDRVRRALASGKVER